MGSCDLGSPFQDVPFVREELDVLVFAALLVLHGFLELLEEPAPAGLLREWIVCTYVRAFQLWIRKATLLHKVQWPCLTMTEPDSVGGIHSALLVRVMWWSRRRLGCQHARETFKAKGGWVRCDVPR